MLFTIRENHPQVLKNAIKTIGSLSPKKTWDVDIREHKSNRSKAQNRYLHKLIDLLVEETGENKKQLKRDIAWSVGLLETYNAHERGLITMPKHTSDMNLEEMGEMILATQMACMQMEITYPIPSDMGIKI